MTPEQQKALADGFRRGFERDVRAIYERRVRRLELTLLTSAAVFVALAARHALFAAVHEGALPDPLSKEWTR